VVCGDRGHDWVAGLLPAGPIVESWIRARIGGLRGPRSTTGWPRCCQRPAARLSSRGFGRGSGGLWDHDPRLGGRAAASGGRPIVESWIRARIGWFVGTTIHDWASRPVRVGSLVVPGCRGVVWVVVGGWRRRARVGVGVYGDWWVGTRIACRSPRQPVPGPRTGPVRRTDRTRTRPVRPERPSTPRPPSHTAPAGVHRARPRQHAGPIVTHTPGRGAPFQGLTAPVSFPSFPLRVTTGRLCAPDAYAEVVAVRISCTK
jgi:hypothetical protein